jgi:hypothetical protein
VKRFRQTVKLNVQIRVSLQRHTEQGLERGRMKSAQVIPETSQGSGMPYIICCNAANTLRFFYAKLMLFSNCYHGSAENDVINLSGCLQRWGMTLSY